MTRANPAHEIFCADGEQNAGGILQIRLLVFVGGIDINGQRLTVGKTSCFLNTADQIVVIGFGLHVIGKKILHFFKQSVFQILLQSAGFAFHFNCALWRIGSVLAGFDGLKRPVVVKSGQFFNFMRVKFLQAL